MRKSFQEIIVFMEERVPFNKYLGIKVDELREGFARFSVSWLRKKGNGVEKGEDHGK